MPARLRPHPHPCPPPCPRSSLRPRRRPSAASCHAARTGPRPWSRTALVALLLACAAAPLQAADDANIAAFSTAQPGDPAPAWKFVSLPHKKPTSFTVVALDGAKVLKVEADDSYGNLVHAVAVRPTAHTTLAWVWRVDQLVADADLRQRSGDDSPAKICLFFAYDASRLSLGERARLSLAHSSTGQDVPTETLCYVWDNKLAPGTAQANAFTRRIRFIVVDSGAERLGQWVSHQRDVVADYQRLFGDESDGAVPDLSGVAVAADADNTHGHALAYDGDIVLTP